MMLGLSRQRAVRPVTYALLRLQELLFVFGLKWGVVGAALAPAIGQYVGLAVMVGLLIREKALFAKDLASIPTLAECTPLLQVCPLRPPPPPPPRGGDMPHCPAPHS